MKNCAVFLDRDGVINEIVYHKEIGIVDSPFHVKQFKLINNIDHAINKFKELKFKVIIISNQPGIAKNHHDMIMFEKINEKMHKDLFKKGIKIDAEYYCFHHPDAIFKKYKKTCECRKPRPGMIIKASKDFDIELSKSWMIGDGINDIKAGNTAGCKTILIGNLKCDICKILEEENARPSFIAPNLYKAALIIEKERKNNGNLSRYC